MSKYQSKTIGLDPERGDQLTTRLADVKAIFADDIIRREQADRIAGCFFRWFCGKTEEEATHGEEPIVQVFVKTLMNRQREGVRKYVDQCNSRSPKKGKSDETDDDDRGGRDKVTYPDISRDKATCEDNKIKKGNEEKKLTEGNKVFSTSFLSPVGGDTAGNPPSADGAAADARPTAHTPTDETRTANVEEWPDHSAKTFDERDLRERPVQFVLDMGIDEDENRARPFYMKALGELGPDVYAETCWRFVTEYTKAANEYGETMRQLSVHFDAHADEYEAKGETWESILEKAEARNWHLVKTERDQYERYRDGGRILAGMLKEAGLAHGIDLGAKRPKKGRGE